MTAPAHQDRSVSMMAATTERLRGALLESRRRWRDLVGLAADLAFETDEMGRLTFLYPDHALGWAAGALIGQDSGVLLTDGGAGFDPFRATTRVRHRRVWLRRGDGGVARVAVSVEPLLDGLGRITGTRGLGVDMSDMDSQGVRLAEALRLGETLDHILERMGAEVLAPRMLRAALDSLALALGAEGAAIIAIPHDDAPRVAHATGNGAMLILPTAGALLADHPGSPVSGVTEDGQRLLVDTCRTRFGGLAGIVAWRGPQTRGWSDDETRLLASAGRIIRMALEHEAIQHEMLRQARTDPLTGLLNRRAFREEVLRHTTRSEQEGLPATLMFVDLDHFKSVNDRFGHEAGDEVLRRTATLLREVFRPGDLIARLGGDEFALWLGGADHMTAAERAECLRERVPSALDEITGGDPPRITLSIGIATRHPQADEDIDGLIRRADEAMYEVKRNGRGHWRVSLLEGV